MKELYIKKEECCGCGACVDACPKNAVRMAVDREGFRYPRIDESLCVDCKRCEKVCPLKTADCPGKKNTGEEDIRIREENTGEIKYPRQFFGVQAKDETNRYNSSSGGMFPVLAEYVLSQNGIVYGAAYGKNMRVVHREIRNWEELDAVKRTKYVQSSLKGVYRKIKARLEEDRWVLFCGTPCQAQGLRLYLNKEYSKLVTVDLVCYGAPSPGVWGDYVKYLEKKHGGVMTGFSFRDKRGKDNGHTCSYVIDGKEHVGSLYADSYCRMYFSNHTVRPSCHECKFCTVERGSDFTIGDFWGIEKVKPEFDDGMGTSMVILHTEKAQNIWETVKDAVCWFECEEKDVLQPRLVGPTEKAKSRGVFMAFYKICPFPLFRAGYIVCASVRALLKRF